MKRPNIQTAIRRAAGLTLASALTLSLAACAATDSSRSTGEYVDDATLQSRVKTSLITSDETDGLDIDIEVYRGTVQLNGTADSEEEKIAAGRIAEEVSGVAAVENNLIVQTEARRTGEYIDDKTLEARVAAALAKAEGVSLFDVEVEASRGDVTLGGFVRSEEEKQRAAEIAQRVESVRGVTNGILIRPAASS